LQSSKTCSLIVGYPDQRQHLKQATAGMLHNFHVNRSYSLTAHSKLNSLFR